MKKILLILCIVLLPLSVKASCSYSDINSLKQKATNISFGYDYIENDNNVKFSVTMTNMSPDLYIHDVVKNQDYYYNDSELTINDYDAGVNLQYQIYPTNSDCRYTLLLTRYLNLPYYNHFYKDSICAGLENYQFCKKWSLVNLSYEQLKTNIEQYKNKGTINASDKTKVYVPLYKKTIQFIIQYYYALLVSLVVIGIACIIYLKKKEKNLY